MILLIPDNGSSSVAKEAFVISPWLHLGLAERAYLPQHFVHTGRASLGRRWGQHEPRLTNCAVTQRAMLVPKVKQEGNTVMCSGYGL